MGSKSVQCIHVEHHYTQKKNNALYQVDIYAIPFKYKKERIWDTFHSIVLMERACLGHVKLLPTSLHHAYTPLHYIVLDLDARYFVCTLHQIGKRPWPKFFFFFFLSVCKGEGPRQCPYLLILSRILLLRDNV